MRLLLDESLPRKLKARLAPHDVRTVPEMGWAGAEIERGAIDDGSRGACASCSGDNDSTEPRQTRPNLKATRPTSRRYSTAGGKA